MQHSETEISSRAQRNPLAPSRTIDSTSSTRDRQHWLPQRLAAEVDERHESHLIRGYD